MISQRRAMGQYSTPPETVDYMVAILLSHLNTKKSRPQILDPATGDGIFIKKLIQTGVSPEQIYAYDMDPSIPAPEKSIHFSHKDFLKVEEKEQFDAIIGNPPYKSKRQSSYFTNNKQFLTKEFEQIGIHNLYSLFIYKGIQLLKENGILTMIIQDSFLTNVYYKHFRDYLLKNTEMLEITLAPRRLFHEGKADVRTSIFTIRKRKPKNSEHSIRLVDRLQNQNYFNPPEKRVQYLPQSYYTTLPNSNFAINVPVTILDLFQESYTPLGDIVKIGTGISTGKDRFFLRKAEEIAGNDDWVPFYKNGGKKDAWYYEPRCFIHKDWSYHHKKYPTYSVRNSDYFFKEGITCSSMGVKFSASYLPTGCLFGVNANIFPDNQEDLFYLLGFLNSNLVEYILRKVLNRTNMITSGYLKKLPYISPSMKDKKKIAALTKTLVHAKQENPLVETEETEKKIDTCIFDVYGVSEDDQVQINEFCADVLEQI